MNPYGSYRKLLDNSQQAMLAAIEIYNKPNFSYREEIFLILLTNAWELMNLAILSKNKKRIFEPKKPNIDYRTWSFADGLKKAADHFPENTSIHAVIENLFLIYEFRNKATHYYNERELAHCVYVLSQAAIKNYRDICLEIFKIDINHKINLILLPLSFSDQPDFIEFFKTSHGSERSPLSVILFKKIEEIESMNLDTTRFITQCTIKLESVKKITSADLNVGISSQAGSTVVFAPPRDPNVSHPLGRKDLIKKLKQKSIIVNQSSFEGICWHYKLKDKEEHGYKYAWKSDRAASAWCYTSECLNFISKLSSSEIDAAYKAYKARNS